MHQLHGCYGREICWWCRRHRSETMDGINRGDACSAASSLRSRFVIRQCPKSFGYCRTRITNGKSDALYTHQQLQPTSIRSTHLLLFVSNSENRLLHLSQEHMIFGCIHVFHCQKHAQWTSSGRSNIVVLLELLRYDMSKHFLCIARTVK